MYSKTSHRSKTFKIGLTFINVRNVHNKLIERDIVLTQNNIINETQMMNIDKSIWLQFPLWGVRKQVHNTKSSFNNTKGVIHSTEHPVDTSYPQHTRCSTEHRENRVQITIT